MNFEGKIALVTGASRTQLLQKLWKQFQNIVKKMASLIHLLTMTKWR